jgi:hypothetical protein
MTHTNDINVWRLHCVDDPVLTDADTIEVVFAFELLHTSRTWIFAQFSDGFYDPALYSLRQTFNVSVCFAKNLEVPLYSHAREETGLRE